jgi:membrane fusion protein (multidrug efflux system)
LTAEKRAAAETMSFVGRIDAAERVDVRARVTGYLVSVLFKDGEQVSVGTPLYRIERGPFEAALQQAQANVTRNQAQLDNATLQRKRADELVKTNAVPVATRDDRVTAEKSAQGNLAAAEADQKTTEINLGYTEINSPLNGKIGRTAVTPGNVVGPDSGVLTTIVSQDPMYVTFPVSQREFLRLAEERKGKSASANDFKVNIRFSNGTLYPLSGRINFVDVKVDRATDTITVRATVPNPDGVLVDGQLVLVEVQSDKVEERVVIPQAALIADQQGPYVFVVENGKAAIRRLKLGQSKGPMAVVTEGLSGGEAVVVEGAQSLRPGAEVKTVPAGKPLGG